YSLSAAGPGMSTFTNEFAGGLCGAGCATLAVRVSATIRSSFTTSTGLRATLHAGALLGEPPPALDQRSRARWLVCTRQQATALQSSGETGVTLTQTSVSPESFAQGLSVTVRKVGKTTAIGQ